MNHRKLSTLGALKVAEDYGLPAWAALTASNACVGGPATAAAMASARGWTAAVQPAIVVGSIGYAVGTPIGCLVGQALGAWF